MEKLNVLTEPNYYGLLVYVIPLLIATYIATKIIVRHYVPRKGPRQRRIRPLGSLMS